MQTVPLWPVLFIVGIPMIIGLLIGRWVFICDGWRTYQRHRCGYIYHGHIRPSMCPRCAETLGWEAITARAQLLWGYEVRGHEQSASRDSDIALKRAGWTQMEIDAHRNRTETRTTN